MLGWRYRSFIDSLLSKPKALGSFSRIESERDRDKDRGRNRERETETERTNDSSSFCKTFI
jgi:hypothetical protein